MARNPVLFRSMCVTMLPECAWPCRHVQLHMRSTTILHPQAPLTTAASAVFCCISCIQLAGAVAALLRAWYHERRSGPAHLQPVPPTHGEKICCRYGTMGLGAVLHTLNPRLFATELECIVNHEQDQ